MTIEFYPTIEEALTQLRGDLVVACGPEDNLAVMELDDADDNFPWTRDKSWHGPLDETEELEPRTAPESSASYLD